MYYIVKRLNITIIHTFAKFNNELQSSTLHTFTINTINKHDVFNSSVPFTQ